MEMFYSIILNVYSDGIIQGVLAVVYSDGTIQGVLAVVFIVRLLCRI